MSFAESRVFGKSRLRRAGKPLGVAEFPKRRSAVTHLLNGRQVPVKRIRIAVARGDQQLRNGGVELVTIRRFLILCSASIAINLAHLLLLQHWPSVGYAFGPRPSSAQLFLLIEGLLAMSVIGIGGIGLKEAGNGAELRSTWMFAVGMLVSASVWIATISAR